MFFFERPSRLFRASMACRSIVVANFTPSASKRGFQHTVPCAHWRRVENNLSVWRFSPPILNCSGRRCCWRRALSCT